MIEYDLPLNGALKMSGRRAKDAETVRRRKVTGYWSDGQF